MLYILFAWIWTSEIGTELSSANSLVDVSEDVLNRRSIAAMWREEEWRQISQRLSGILRYGIEEKGSGRCPDLVDDGPSGTCMCVCVCVGMCVCVCRCVCRHVYAQWKMPGLGG